MDSEQTLEAVLINQKQGNDEINHNLETLIAQNEKNKLDDILEAQLVTQDKILKKQDEISKSKTNIHVEINGSEMVEYKGEKGDKGDEPSDERLTGLIKPLIPEVKDGKNGKDGKDADVQEISKKVLGIVLPELPTIEEIVSQIPIPKNGRNGLNGLDGRDGRDGEPGKDGKDGASDTPRQVKSKLLEEGINYSDLKEKPDIDSLIDRVNKTSSKTVSLVELDDVDLSNLTKTNGKYILGGASGGVSSVNGETGAVVLDTGDITEVTNKKYATDAEKVKLSNLSGTNTGDQNLFGILAVSGQSNVVADSTNDTLTLVAGSNVTITTDASSDSITINATTGGGGTVNTVIAGTGISVNSADPVNPIVSSTITQYTDEMAQDAVGGILTDTSTIDFSYNDAGNSITADVKDGSITNAKISTGIDAIKIADGSVTNAEFQYIGGLTSDVQTQLNAKATTSGNLSQFAPTTSAQLAGIISDETGSGALVFGTSPRITTSILDANGATIIGLTPTASANSYLTVTNGNSSAPKLGVGGTSSDLLIASGNTGSLSLAGGGTSALRVTGDGTSSGNYVGITDGGSGSTEVFISASGSSSNIDLGLSGKGTSKVHFRSGSYGGITADADGATITFNMATSNIHSVTLGGNRTLAVSNVSAGQAFMLRLQQDGTGTRTVTWFSTIKWAGGVAPTLTPTINKADLIGFLCTGSGTYDGFVIGQNI